MNHICQDCLNDDEFDGEFKHVFNGSEKSCDFCCSDADFMAPESDLELAAMRFLDDVGADISRWEDVVVTNQTPEEYAMELVDDLYDAPECLSHYIDYKGLAKDLMIEGNIVECDGYLITNALEF